MTVLVTKNTTNNTTYSVQEPRTFYNHSMELYLEFHYKSFHFHQYFCCVVLLIHC